VEVEVVQDEVVRERAMVVVAHPDDPEFSCGGTVAKWVRQGVEVTYVVCTNGDKGTRDPTLRSEELAKLRRAEQLASAARLGVSNVEFLPFRDGEIRADLGVRREICRRIRKYRPDTVITHDPSMYYSPGGGIRHPDHKAVGEATLAAVFPAARDRLYCPEMLAEGLEPHRVGEVLLVGAVEPDYWVDVSGTIDDKIAAIMVHETQVGGREGLGDRIKERTGRVGEARGMGHAEAYRRLDLRR
jgi:LmbE family N-acetylglucosaminyl deacetylase